MGKVIDFLADFTREQYEELRNLFPEDGTEYTKWQILPKLPEEGKTVITFNSNDVANQIEFDELCFRGDDYDCDDERTYWRHHYCWDKVNMDIHYWKYAPDEPPGNEGYNVGD